DGPGTGVMRICFLMCAYVCMGMFSTPLILAWCTLYPFSISPLLCYIFISSCEISLHTFLMFYSSVEFPKAIKVLFWIVLYLMTWIYATIHYGNVLPHWILNI